MHRFASFFCIPEGIYNTIRSAYARKQSPHQKHLHSYLFVCVVAEPRSDKRKRKLDLPLPHIRFRLMYHCSIRILDARSAQPSELRNSQFDFYEVQPEKELRKAGAIK